MSSLSTHVLDTANGQPAVGVALKLFAEDGTLLHAGSTNEDGRCPNLPPLEAGRYYIEFSIAAYFRSIDTVLPEPPFLDVIRIDFGIADAIGHYHVPLLVSPYGYSTYRGS